MQNFIYVFDKDARDKLLAMQYEMLVQHSNDRIFVFLNKDRVDFAANDFQFALTDTLFF